MQKSAVKNADAISRAGKGLPNDTPMMRRELGAKPFKMTSEKAAELICRGLDRNRSLKSSRTCLD
jgi:hypothetical protein